MFATTCPALAVPKFQLSVVSTNARANPESGPKVPIVSLRLPTARQKFDQGWSLEALNWDNYVAHVHITGFRDVDAYKQEAGVHRFDGKQGCQPQRRRVGATLRRRHRNKHCQKSKATSLCCAQSDNLGRPYQNCRQRINLDCRRTSQRRKAFCLCVRMKSLPRLWNSNL